MFAETRRQNLFTLNRQYPLPDIHIDTLAKIESGVRTILAQEEMTQSDFEKFGINMLLLLGGSQDFAWQHAQVTNPGGIELGDPLTMIVERRKTTREIFISFKDGENHYTIRWDRGKETAHFFTTPHEEGIWATGDPEYPAVEVKKWLEKGLTTYENRSIYQKDEVFRRRQIAGDRISREAINPIGLRNSRIDKYGHRVPIPVDEHISGQEGQRRTFGISKRQGIQAR